MGVLEEFDTLSEKLHFDENWKIYRFHSGLGSVYNAYCEQYNQTHDAFDDKGDPKFALDYAITRFINTITNPTNSTSSVETQALAALVHGTFAHTPQSVIALVAAGGAAETKIQAGAHAGNSRTYTQTVKYCSHCKKDWHTDSECTTLHPHLKNRGENCGRGGGGRGGRGSRGGRGGNNNNPSNDDKNKPLTDVQAAAAVTESVAFSFMAYAEQPSSAATFLIANS